MVTYPMNCTPSNPLPFPKIFAPPTPLQSTTYRQCLILSPGQFRNSPEINTFQTPQKLTGVYPAKANPKRKSQNWIPNQGRTGREKPASPAEAISFKANCPQAAITSRP